MGKEDGELKPNTKGRFGGPSKLTAPQEKPTSESEQSKDKAPELDKRNREHVGAMLRSVGRDDKSVGEFGEGQKKERLQRWAGEVAKKTSGWRDDLEIISSNPPPTKIDDFTHAVQFQHIDVKGAPFEKEAQAFVHALQNAVQQTHGAGPVALPKHLAQPVLDHANTVAEGDQLGIEGIKLGRKAEDMKNPVAKALAHKRAASKLKKGMEMQRTDTSLAERREYMKTLLEANAGITAPLLQAFHTMDEAVAQATGQHLNANFVDSATHGLAGMRRDPSIGNKLSWDWKNLG